ncbi:uncharacterized protein I206_106045 [Kwoniella pini CBS 10737]|uniref:Ubiquitin-like domain-containing protein n=1 Tax=Kwoniella pini CBS 10737 TaxID=1296096 RepID=A0A1B9I0W3_9TREE|nr:uncharacterized protein I206_04868 [Kwoniella pini CBS 10737]OCF49180.1 hypothetical protein I206_04868 [Kwoniella pini CBS 10737]
MPPKSSNLHHITFHFNKSAILLSLPSNTTINLIKSQLLKALQPLSTTLSFKPNLISDIQLWEYKEIIEGQEIQEKEIKNLEDDESNNNIGNKSISTLGWERWKVLFISFKNPDDSTFSKPVYTIPDVEDEEPDETEI